MILLLASLAAALPCADPFTADEFRELVASAETALDNDDVMGHGQTWVRMKESMPCLVDPLPKDEWARYLIGYAIIRHATGEKWRAPLLTALRIDPDIDRDYGHSDIRQFPAPPPEELRGLELAPDEAFLLDGLVIPIAPPFLDGPHIVQMAGEPYKTRLLIDADFPADWLAPKYQAPADPLPTPDLATVQPEPPRAEPILPKKRGKPLLIAGVSVGAIGAAVALTSFAVGTADDKNYQTPQPFNALVIANATGWSLAGIGAGLVSIHAVRGLTVDVSPTHLGIRGRL